MAHKDKQTREFRLWLRPDVVRDIKLLALIRGRDDWNQVANDCLALGVAYINEVAKLELADWHPGLELPGLRDLHLQTLKGDLPMPEER